MFKFFCFAAERHTSLPCSTLERARRTSAPSCPTARAVRPLKTLCLDLDGRCRLLDPQRNIPSTVATRPRLPFPVLLRWTSLHTVASWADSRGMAAQALQPLTTLPPPWKPSFTCPPACRLILMTAWLKRFKVLFVLPMLSSWFSRTVLCCLRHLDHHHLVLIVWPKLCMLKKKKKEKLFFCLFKWNGCTGLYVHFCVL